ncbi:hypothetical protein FDECE_16033, partial [Fusarium decemcellulare]
MRSAVLLRVALGLLVVDSAVAGPCRPTTSMTISALTSSASVDTSSATSVEPTASVASATSSSSTESSVETSESSTATSTVSTETSAFTESESSTETSASSTASVEMSSFTTSQSSTETSASSASTDYTTSTTTETTSTTSTAPEITFSIAATGSGPAAGKGLHTYNHDQTAALFDFSPDFSASIGNPEVRPFNIDGEGRLINDQGWYLCGTYDLTSDLLDAPAVVSTCNSPGEPPLGRVFLRCQVTVNYKLTCSIPALTCVAPATPLLDPTCETGTGTWTHFTSNNSGQCHFHFI